MAFTASLPSEALKPFSLVDRQTTIRTRLGLYWFASLGFPLGWFYFSFLKKVFHKAKMKTFFISPPKGY